MYHAIGYQMAQARVADLHHCAARASLARVARPARPDRRGQAVPRSPAAVRRDR
jgi:hypothetical protein